MVKLAAKPKNSKLGIRDVLVVILVFGVMLGLLLWPREVVMDRVQKGDLSIQLILMIQGVDFRAVLRIENKAEQEEFQIGYVNPKFYDGSLIDRVGHIEYHAHGQHRGIYDIQTNSYISTRGVIQKGVWTPKHK